MNERKVFISCVFGNQSGYLAHRAWAEKLIGLAVSQDVGAKVEASRNKVLLLGYCVPRPYKFLKPSRLPVSFLHPFSLVISGLV